MNKELRRLLIAAAQEKINGDDPSHDLNHAFRVLATAEKMAKTEGADLDVVVPAALFHDIVNHPKNDPRSKHNSDESAEVVTSILTGIEEYPREKVAKVASAIRTCSFTKGIVPDMLEAKILQDADGLEATGAISIMRTFASSGSMKRTFYHTQDPFARGRPLDDMKYAIDLFYTRLLKVNERMHTESAKKIAKRRRRFLEGFLKEFELELMGK